MIDSLWLYAEFPQVEIGPQADLEVVPVPSNLRTGEKRRKKDGGQIGFEIGGRYVNGLYTNTDYYSFDFSNKGGVVKIYSLPRLVKQSREAIDPVTLQEAEQGVKRVREELFERGVVFPEESKVVRADLFRNCNVSLPPACYSNMLRGVGGQRTVQKTFGDSVLFGNASRQASFYSKVDQVKDVYGVDLSARGNILRAEFRALKGKSVARDLSVVSSRDLSRKWNELPGRYSELMKELVFSRQDFQSELADLHSKLTFYRDLLGGQGPKSRWLNRSVFLLGLERFASLTKQERRDLLVPLAGLRGYHRIESEIKKAGVFAVESERALYSELLRLVA
jgi:hypothetical protein